MSTEEKKINELYIIGWNASGGPYLCHVINHNMLSIICVYNSVTFGFIEILFTFKYKSLTLFHFSGIIVRMIFRFVATKCTSLIATYIQCLVGKLLIKKLHQAFSRPTLHTGFDFFESFSIQF